MATKDNSKPGQDGQQQRPPKRRNPAVVEDPTLTKLRERGAKESAKQPADPRRP
jgi:hypothetical protein